jgi:Type I restriction enzyme R protein N terminus (HSDR_N)
VVQTVAANQVTLRELRESFGLELTQDASFFSEWRSPQPLLGEADRQLLDRVKENFTAWMEDPPMMENTVKMVVLAPLMNLAGFYRIWIETEPSVEISTEDEGLVIRGRIDVSVLKERLWLLVIESKRSDFSVTRAIPQALAYLLGNSRTTEPTFGMITNGNEFLFLKATHPPMAQYANSRLFSLVNPDNDLYEVLQVLKQLGMGVVNP